jgi:hypothetical protein
MKRSGGRTLAVVLLAGCSLLGFKVSGTLPVLSALAWTANDAATSIPQAPPAPASATPASEGMLAAFGLSGEVTCRSNPPPTHSPWLAVAESDAEHYQIDPIGFSWKIYQESGFNPNVTSPAGALGIAQFMPATAQGMSIDPTDPAQALDASAKLDASHIRAYADRARQLAEHYGGSSARYGYALALAAYNAGPGATDSAWNRAFGGGWPDSPWAWLSYLGGETQRYVPNILGCSLQ